jgi:hypothetical protein
MKQKYYSGQRWKTTGRQESAKTAVNGRVGSVEICRHPDLSKFPAQIMIYRRYCRYLRMQLDINKKPGYNKPACYLK